MNLKFSFTDNWYNIKWWFKNQYLYSRQFLYIRSWDFSCLFYFMLIFFKVLHKSLKNGNEIEETLYPKLMNIERCICIIDNIIQGDYIKLAEERLNLKISNKPFELKKIENTNSYTMVENRTEEEIKNDTLILDFSHEIEQEEWNELWYIIKNNAKSWWD